MSGKRKNCLIQSGSDGLLSSDLLLISKLPGADTNLYLVNCSKTLKTASGKHILIWSTIAEKPLTFYVLLLIFILKYMVVNVCCSVECLFTVV